MLNEVIQFNVTVGDTAQCYIWRYSLILQLKMEYIAQ